MISFAGAVTGAAMTGGGGGADGRAAAQATIPALTKAKTARDARMMKLGLDPAKKLGHTNSYVIRVVGFSGFWPGSNLSRWDHIDGVKTALDNAADITDLYTFTSPEDARSGMQPIALLERGRLQAPHPVSKPCDFDDPHTYLEIERAKLTGRALDVTLNFLIRGPSATAEDAHALSDGVDAPTKWASPSFPYLAELHGI